MGRENFPTSLGCAALTAVVPVGARLATGSRGGRSHRWPAGGFTGPRVDPSARCGQGTTWTMSPSCGVL